MGQATQTLANMSSLKVCSTRAGVGASCDGCQGSWGRQGRRLSVESVGQATQTLVDMSSLKVRSARGVAGASWGWEGLGGGPGEAGIEAQALSQRAT